MPHISTALGIDSGENDIETTFDRELADVTGITRRVIDGELTTF